MNNEFAKIDEYHNVTPQQLQDDIIPNYRPAVLRGLAKDWRISDKANQSDDAVYQYVKSLIGKTNDVVSYIGPEAINKRFFYNDTLTGVNFRRVKESFSDGIDRIFSLKGIVNPDSVYVGAADIRSNLPQFENDNPMPLLDDQTTMVPRIWMGNSATVSTHYDTFDNIAVNANGNRRFTLFPPEQVSNLYVGPLEHTISGVPASLVNIDAPDFDKHPLYKEALASASMADLAQGDAIYIPPLWWHNVRSNGDFNILVNYWWNNPEYRIEGAYPTMLHGLYSISQLPEKERLAWRSFFDHYVFRPDNIDPAEHLTDDKKGVLSRMTPRLYETIKSYVLSQMNSKD